MLPKLLDVPISTYLMVLAKMRRPSATPSASTSRSFSSRMTSAASLATSVAESTEMPTSAACRASASLTPSPRNATPPPLRALHADDAGLVLRADPGEHGGARRSPRPARRRPARRARRRSAPPPSVEPEVVADLDRHGGVVAGDDLDRDAEAGQPLQRAGGVGLGRVEEHQEAGQAAGRCSSAGVGARSAATRAGGDRDDPVAGGELGGQRGPGGLRARRGSGPAPSPGRPW